MVRRAAPALALLAALCACAAASAGGGVRATFTRPIPTNRSTGEHVLVVWKLRDAAGRPVTLRRVFVRIVCPEGNASTTAYATTTTPGLYQANAAVPPGGIGTVTIGAKGATIRVTNPFHR